jgi:ASC-1-like (ASCH) protein
MRIIHKKVWPEYFKEILTGKKKFELRLADFDVQPGDKLILKEWDNEQQKYTGRTIEVIATYVLKTRNLEFWAQENIDKYGYQIIQFVSSKELKLSEK